MSHVDEGTLHAYLDGELPSAERAAVDAHIAQCEACRARLVEERALLERASALLGAARPAERPAPPFEQLRREPKRSPWRVRTSFAWAASIALALGVGYYLNEVGYRAAPESGLTSHSIAAQDQAARTRSPQNEPVTPPVANATPVREEQPRQFGRLRATERDQEKQSVEQLYAPSAGRVDSSALKVAARAAPRVAAPNAVTGGAPAWARDSAAVATEVPPAVQARMQRQDGLTERKATATTWPRIDRETAREILGEDPVGLADLTTRGYRLSPDRDGIVVVEQQLDDRTVIQIFQQQSARASSRLDSLVSGGYGYSRALEQRRRADRLARFVGKLRVEIGGPVSVDSLNRLLELVGPLP